MATKIKVIRIEVQNDDRGRVIYHREDKDFAVYAPTGDLLDYTNTIGAATEALNAWHYENAKAAAEFDA